MLIEQDLISLRARVAELESRIDFLYKHLGLADLQDPDMAEAKIIAMLKKGNKIEAIKIYRENYRVDLAEAKHAVDRIESRLGI